MDVGLVGRLKVLPVQVLVSQASLMSTRWSSGFPWAAVAPILLPIEPGSGFLAQRGGAESRALVI
jgi:hypothetical protein